MSRTQEDTWAKTIVGLKAKLNRKDDASDSDSDIQTSTNRGSKLKRKAKYVQQGRLDNPNGSQTYKEKVNHAGYDRYIISRNPPPYLNEFGEEISEDDEWDDVDAPLQEENIYENIKLEELLAPLASAAELPTHPAMSVPYYSTDLPEMVESARAMLHKEQQTLWRMKHLLRGLRGDQTWIPCGQMQTEFDDWLLSGEQQVSSAPASRTSFVNGASAADITMQIWGSAPNAHLQGGLEVVKIPPLGRMTTQQDRHQNDTESAMQVEVANDIVPSGTMVNGQDASSSSLINGVVVSTQDTSKRNTGPQTNGVVHPAAHTDGVLMEPI
ncbi:hypothetical protein LTS18_013704, partial [Coniosporium uncinatum]